MNVLPRTRRRTWFASGLTGVLTAGMVFALVAGPSVVVATAAHADEATSSAVTVTAKDQDPTGYQAAPFPDLAVTVSQTQGLIAQGITVSWTGGLRSTEPTAGNGGANFLQVFQCWGDDPSSPLTPRPDRTTCQYGGALTAGGMRDSTRQIPYSEIPLQDQPYSVPGRGIFPPYTSIPFVARDKTVVSSIDTAADGTKKVNATSVNTNQFFTKYTTNEVPWAGSSADGAGSISFEVQTAAQSPGLGCGNAVTDAGTTVGASCWLVVLPRGTADNGSTAITDSGLFWDSWRHALAVRLGFQPIDARCPDGAAERQLAGSELVALAVTSWQPVVCNQKGGSVYALLTLPESDALATANRADGAAPMALTSRPLSSDAGPDRLSYAPVALTALTIAFGIDRAPSPFGHIDDEYLARARQPFTSLKLTPRLVAKLLTDSYKRAIPTGADLAYLGTNPEVITSDPDFLAVNDPEWASQLYQTPALADLISPQGRSDAAWALWSYVLADPEARAFLDGEPDPWGMRVNPWYSTSAAINAGGTALTLPREDFPRADPVEVRPEGQAPINLVAWRPYANDLDSVSGLVLRGDGLTLGQWDPTKQPPAYSKTGRTTAGYHAVIGVSDFAASSRYQVMTASLRNPAGAFVAVSEKSLTAAASAMTGAGAGGAVLAFDSSSAEARRAADAYPLALPVYAAASPRLPDSTLRKAYADFIRYAAGLGQRRGSDVGQLPDGYAPLPQAWVDQAQVAAQAIEDGATALPAPVATPPTSPAAVAVRAATTVSAADVPASQPAASAPAPSATGAASAALAGAKTPDDPASSALAAAVPGSLLAGTGGALAVPLISRLRRRVL